MYSMAMNLWQMYQMCVNCLLKAQRAYEHQVVDTAQPAVPVAQEATEVSTSSLYPILDDYMGLSGEVMAQHMAQVRSTETLSLKHMGQKQ